MVLIIKKIIAALLAAVSLLHSCPAAAADHVPDISAKSAIVLHSGGEVLYEKNADEKMLIASTTKIMTAIVAIENCAPDETVKVTKESCHIEGSSMYLKEGQKLSVEKLLLGLLLVSGNDAASALAIHTAGSTERFAALMNEKAAQLGMENTHFVNPHGLNAEDHYSTARDMARLMAYCMENESFADIIARKSFALDDAVYLNHNKLLYSLDGCIGGKTGYTIAAGRCLVSCAERDGTRYVVVTLSAPDDWNDHTALYEWAFAKYRDRDMSDHAVFDVPVAGGAEETARAVPAEKLSVYVGCDEELAITASLPRFVLAPVRKGESAGSVAVYSGNELLKECPLVYEKDISASEVEQKEWKKDYRK